MLNLLDWAVTFWGIDQGILAEANPVMAHLVMSPVGLLLKTVGVGLALVAMVRWGNPNSVALRLLLMFYVAVVTWNLTLVLGSI